jgi:hypothetical protein
LKSGRSERRKAKFERITWIKLTFAPGQQQQCNEQKGEQQIKQRLNCSAVGRIREDHRDRIP